MFQPTIQEIGWRNGSLRIVLVITDAGFKTALDGKVRYTSTVKYTYVYDIKYITSTLPFCTQVAALIRPNDGKCHLEWNSEEGFYEYIRHPEQVNKCVNMSCRSK